MGYEVDFLAVGQESSSGDAIAFRYGNLYGYRNEQTVGVIDGGTKESGRRLVEHINRYYGTNSVDLVINTHPDSDHASGLSVVLEEMEVGRLWMHRPWNHAGKLRGVFRDGRITDNSLSEKFKKSLSAAHDLEVIANRKGIPITEPFSDSEADSQFAEIWVFGPDTETYRELLSQFDCAPELSKSLGETMFGRASEAIKSVAESRGWETLTEPLEETTPRNNSSAILFLRVDGRDLLFTGDAGVIGLEGAADCAESCAVDLRSCVFQQIPHHGSKRNVGPSILNRIVGSIGAAQNKTAFVSASEGGAPKHPAKKVTNAYQRRGATVMATRGQNIVHRHNSPPRAGWGPVTPVPFYTVVED